MKRKKITYKDSGVNIEKAEGSLKKIKDLVTSTHDKRYVFNKAGYSGIVNISDRNLALSCDGVGTKTLLHLKMGTENWAGQDCVGMVLNDICASGAKPDVFLDYYATGNLDTDIFYKVIKGITDSCLVSETVLLGGETAEMPGFYEQGEIDIVGFGLGSFTEDYKLLDPHQEMESGDVVIGVSSSGFHSNGFSLVRKIIDEMKIDIEKPRKGSDTPIGIQLSEPTRLYWPLVKRVSKHVKQIRGFSHVTGGGMIRNFERIIPENLNCIIRPATFSRPTIVDWLVSSSGISSEEAYKTFNMGIGFGIVVPKEKEKECLECLSSLPYPSWKIGEITEGSGKVLIEN